MLLQAVLLPLCYEAGIREDWDEQAAAALLDPILLSSPEEIDATMRGLHVDRRSLVAHRERVRSSAWFEATSGIARDYVVSPARD